MRALCVVAVVVCAACGSPPDTSPPDAGAGVDALPSAPPLTADFGATDGTLDVGFAASLNGHGTAVEDVAISDDIGTVTLTGDTAPTPIALFSSSSFPGLMLYHGIAVTPDRWSVFFFYCSGANLIDVYWESSDQTDAALQEESLTGTCNDTGAGIAVQVQFPAAHLVVPRNVTGFTATGPDISLAADGSATITLGGTPLDFAPFAFVDCTSCSTTEGWLELHGILYDKASARACFSILYLFTKPTRQMLLDYTLTLPDLSDPAMGETSLDGVWTGP